MLFKSLSPICISPSTFMVFGRTHPPEYGWQTKNHYLKEAYSSLSSHLLSISPQIDWGWWALAHYSMLQCWLTWFCTGPLKAAPDSINWWLCVACHTDKKMLYLEPLVYLPLIILHFLNLAIVCTKRSIMFSYSSISLMPNFVIDVRFFTNLCILEFCKS